jgi:hypothetical protein
MVTAKLSAIFDSDSGEAHAPSGCLKAPQPVAAKWSRPIDPCSGGSALLEGLSMHRHQPSSLRQPASAAASTGSCRKPEDARPGRQQCLLPCGVREIAADCQERSPFPDSGGHPKRP